MQYEISELQSSLYSGFIDKAKHSRESLQPSLVTNSKERSSSVLSRLIDEISTCDEFFLSAAFLTKSGVAVLLNSLLEARARGVSGRILVSEYLGFTQPEALRSLQQFRNIEVRVATTGNMHGKTYFFRKKRYDSILIGSSNLTASALKANNEVNLAVTATRDSAIVDQLIGHLQRDFNNSTVANDAYIDEYSLRYKEARFNPLPNPEEHHKSPNSKVTPNVMQRAALKNIQQLRDQGKSRALIISATGTGKTYLSAFDVESASPSKVLFVVHRKNIALAALATYKKLFGAEKSYGIFSGSDRDIDSDFVFSTVQTISREEHLRAIDPELFDYIIVDETHRAGADSYQKLINYFRPKFLLGMTATPERTDGHDIFADFHHNIAYEIRLHQALEAEILAPFHYFGVTDLTVDGKEIDDLSDFNSLVSNERVNHIRETAKIYGSDTGITRGLIFCSRKAECISLSKSLNSTELKTLALTGDNTEADRENAIKRLESDLPEEKLDYIITVDIFNEGIDIPKVNQILMLRPTSSAIIFVQQLGRGLRKAEGKDYLTVIDFIGNYQNNYLVPIALYGDTSFNKDRIRKLMSEGSNNIPGTSTINFDQITRKKIFDSIDQSNLNLLRDMKADYKLLKYELGFAPMMMDFVRYGKRDPFSFVNYSKSYYQFVKKADPESTPELDPSSIELLSAFAREVNSGKRVEDSIALRQLVENGRTDIGSIRTEVRGLFGYSPTSDTILSAMLNVGLEYPRERFQNRQAPICEKLGYDVIESEGDQAWHPSSKFSACLSNSTFREFILDSIKYSIDSWSKSVSKSNVVDGFILYEKYSRRDIFRILQWKQSPVELNVGGYQMSGDKKNMAIFVTYEKQDHSSSTQYEDEFLDEAELKWMSKNRRDFRSPEIVELMDQGSTIRLPLFVKKSNDEGTDFYYMGELSPIHDSFEKTSITNDEGTSLSAITLRFNVDPPVERNIYKYITGD